MKWLKLFTDESIMTVKDLNAALDGISYPKKKRSFIKEQFSFWVEGAGWKKERQFYSQGGEDIETGYLADKLRELIATKVECKNPKALRAQVLRPTQLTSSDPLPLLGDALNEALKMRDEMIAEEQRKMDKAHSRMELLKQLSVML